MSSGRMPPFGASTVETAPGPTRPHAVEEPTDFVPGGPPTRGRSRLVHGALPRTVWFLLVGLATVVLVLSRLPLDLAVRLADHHAAEAAAVAVTTAYAAALAYRVGGRPFVSLAVGLVLGLAAVATGRPEVAAGVAVATAVIAGMLAVVLTLPAPGPVSALREVVVALAVSVVGALAVSAYGAGVQPMRFDYLALAVALAGSLVIAGRLGSGLSGLSPRGILVLSLAVLAVIVAVAYGEALTRWGSADLVAALDRFSSMLRERLGAVPHPIEALIGWPALIWGVTARAQRPHAWWICVFGIAATVPLAGSLVDPSVPVERVALSAGSSLVLGLLVGMAVVTIDLALAGSGGRRSARGRGRGGRRTLIRPEPGRTSALR